MAPRLRLLLAVLFLCVLAVSLTPIRSWDYFWHLSTGEWILQQHALPVSDPFSIGTDQVDWVDGAWLFQIAVAALQRVGSHELVSITRAIFTALLLATLFVIASRRCDEWIALLLSAVASWGAWHRLEARPETAGVACAAVAVALLQRRSTRAVVAYALLSVFWVNVHPSALLAPLFAAAALGGAVARRAKDEVLSRTLVVIASSLALLVNPWGWRGVAAPLQLAQQVGSGGFVNLEWLPSDPRVFPLLYLAIVAGIAVIVRDRLRHPFEAFLFVLLSVLAARWVRNHAFFFVLMPLLLSPMLAAFRLNEQRRKLASIIAVAALVLSLSPLLSQPPGIGADSDRYPSRAAKFIKSLQLKGNIFNADQFGGFLIWNVLPERRVLIDGRNELYSELIPRLLEGRRDGRAWKKLLDDYEIRIAVEEHFNQPLQVVDPATGAVRFGSPSLAYFPRREWALVAVDPASMLFVRRDTVNPAVLARYEYTSWRPDIVDPSEIPDIEAWEREKRRGVIELRSGEPIS